MALSPTFACANIQKRFPESSFRTKTVNFAAGLTKPASPGREQIRTWEPRGGLPNKFVDIWKNDMHYFWFFNPVPGVLKQDYLTSFQI